MKEALYANGMIGGDSLTKELNAIQAHAIELRDNLSSSDLPGVEAEFASDAPYPEGMSGNVDQLSDEAPFPATAEAEPVGS